MRSFVVVVAVLAVACGKKADKSPAAGSASTPRDAAAAAVADAAPLAVDAEAGSAAGSGSASAALDLCKVAKVDDIETEFGPLPGYEDHPNPTNLPAGAEGILGCDYEFVNTMAYLEAKPLAEFDDKLGKYKSVVKGLGDKAILNEEDGTVLVKLPGKSWFLKVTANAGERNPLPKMAVAFAKTVVKAMK